MKYLLFAILLVAVIITAGCVQPGPTKSYPKSTVVTTPTSKECKYDTCNGICYYKGSQTCCGGHLYDIDDGSCCGGIIHDYYKDPGTCCGGKWYVSGTKGECCPNPGELNYKPSWQNYEQVWINVSIQHCCAGKVAEGGKNIRYGNDWTVCGNSCYDPGTQSCCMSGAEQGRWTSYDIRIWNEAADYTLKVYEGKNRCCTHGIIKLCPEGVVCCYNNSGAMDSEPTCKVSTPCDVYGWPGGSGNTVYIPIYKY